jgi:sugar lactone lactonase YvrE
MIGTAKGAKAMLHRSCRGQHQHKPAWAREPCEQLEFQSTVLLRKGDLACKRGVPLERAFPAARILVAFATNSVGFAELLLLLAVGTWPALSQTSPLYAWTNFVGEPGFEEPVAWSVSAGNVGSVDGIGSAARFNSPCGVAVDDAGNLFVADTRNHRIRKVTPDGLVTMLAGGPGARGTDGDTNGAMPMLGPDGQLADGPGASGTNDGTGRAARFYRPESVAVDHAGNAFVADTMNNTIRKVTSAGVVTTLAGIPGDCYPRGGFATAGAMPIYDGPAYAEHRYRMVTEFVAHLTADGTGSAAGFNGPGGVTVDRTGNVFVADTFNQTIRKITPAGLVTTLAGGPGSIGSADGTGRSARFNFPYSVAVDQAGNVFVADTMNHTIRRVTPSGVVTTLAGTAGTPGTNDGTGQSARFSMPTGVAVDRAGSLFVADSGNATIRKVTGAAVVTTIGGTPGVTGWADGVGTSAQFCSPRGIAVDRAGCLYVTDSCNNRISKGSPMHP